MKARYCPCLSEKAGGRRFCSGSSLLPSRSGAAMNVKYRVDLDQGEREQLRVLSSGGKIAARRLKRVQILLAADAGSTTTAWQPASGSANRRSTGPSAASLKRDWMRLWASSPGRVVPASCRAETRLFLWRPPARHRPKGANGGR